MPDEAPAPEGAPPETPALRCDFCGEEVPHVRRIVLDRGYERLQTPHPVRYACERCSQRKEERRLGGGRA